MSFRAALILLLSFYAISQVESSCMVCATRRLKEDWALTGLSVQPKDLTYDDKCSYEPANVKPKVTTTCVKACVTIMIPVDSAYETIRGCFESFTDPADTNQMVNGPTVAGAINCTYYIDSNTMMPPSPVNNDNPAVSKPAVSLVAFHADTVQATVTNIGFTWDELGNGVEALNLLTCVAVTPTKCIQCISFDGKGKCNSNEKNTCTGASCIKVAGKLNGRDFVERGCTYVSPYAVNNVCFASTFTSPFFVGLPTSLTVSRTKRDLEMTYKATQCYCRGNDICNPATMTSLGSLVFVLSLLSALPFL